MSHIKTPLQVSDFFQAVLEAHSLSKLFAFPPSHGHVKNE